MNNPSAMPELGWVVIWQDTSPGNYKGVVHLKGACEPHFFLDVLHKFNPDMPPTPPTHLVRVDDITQECPPEQLGLYIPAGSKIYVGPNGRYRWDHSDLDETTKKARAVGQNV